MTGGRQGWLLLSGHHGTGVAEIVESQVRASRDGQGDLEVLHDGGGPLLASGLGWEE